MPIQLHLERRCCQLSSLEQSLAKAAASRHTMRFQLQSRLADKQMDYHLAAPLQIEENILKRMISKYSEQLVYRPLEELQHWFTYSCGAFLEPGYPPLFYSRTENRVVTANKSAVAGIGEGVAGFLLQRLYRCRKLARPNHDYPDIVMEGNGKIYLVESKATTQSPAEMKQVIEQELMRMAAYTSACAELEAQPVVGILVGTALISESQYYCYLTEVGV